MIMPVLSKYRWQTQTRWNQSAQGWASLRQAYRDLHYPEGYPTALADSLSRDISTYTLPVNCSKIDQYNLSGNGGRANGSTGMAGFLLYPDVTPVNKLMIMAGGHNAPIGWESYCVNDGTSIPIRLMALGYHVLMIEMPGTGKQADPQQVYMGGSLQTPSPTAHSYRSADGDGGPYSGRLFQDSFVRFLNQAIEDIHPTAVVGAGESGGGQQLAVFAAMDNRISRVAICQGGMPFALGGASGGGGATYVVPTADDWEQCLLNDIYQIGPEGDIAGLVGAAAGNGCRVLFCNGAHDLNNFAVRDEWRWREYWRLRHNVVSEFGGSIECYLSPDGHPISEAEAEAVATFLLG